MAKKAALLILLVVVVVSFSGCARGGGDFRERCPAGVRTHQRALFPHDC